MSEANKYNYAPLPEPILITEQVWPEGTLPLVHTRTMTYMHENFIRDCIEGILMQRTTFPVQVLIHDDASTDKTAEIVREYHSKYPNLIKAYYQTENSYSKKDKHERRSTFWSWRIGKYEAVCEGDDYWADPHKLQKQADFLEANADYVLCYHDAVIIDERGQVVKNSLVANKYKRNLSADELKKHSNVIPTASVCYRNNTVERPPEIFNVPAGDTFFYSILGLYGKAGYLAEIEPGRYRRHSGGVWSSLNQESKLFNSAKTYYWIGKYYSRIGEESIAEYFFARQHYLSGMAYYWQGDKMKARRNLFQAAKNLPWSWEIWRGVISCELFGTGQLRQKLSSLKRRLSL